MGERDLTGRRSPDRERERERHMGHFKIRHIGVSQDWPFQISWLGETWQGGAEKEAS